jgi:hypothetical protein
MLITPRSLGWNKPKPQHYARCRAGVGAHALLRGVVPKTKVDLSSLVTIIDQDGLGSCTVNSTAQLVHAAMVAAGLDPSTEFFSRLFAYYLARAEDGNQAIDAGSQNCTVIDAICRAGFCPESAWPYDVNQFAQLPPPEAWREAIDQRGKIDLNYHRIDQGVTGNDLLKVIYQALTAGCLVNFGTPVTNRFCSGDLGSDPILPPTDGRDIAGGHSMAICGYDLTVAKPHLRVVNSWGKDFGDNGFCNFDPTYFTWFETTDMWCCIVSPLYSGGAK